MNVARYVDWNLRRFGCYDAVVWRDRVWNSVELHQAGSRLAAGFVAAGVAPGHRVATILGTCVEQAIAMEGILRAGAVLVPLSPKIPVALTQRILDQCDVRAVVLSRAVIDAAGQACTGGRLCVVADDDDPPPPMVGFWPWLRSHSLLRRAVRRNGDDPAIIWYSSGTTGSPRGVARSHQQVLKWRWASSFAQLRAIVRKTRSQMLETGRPSQVVLAPLPLSHAFGGHQLFLRMSGKALVVMLERFEPHAVLAAIQQYRVTQLSVVPGFAESLLSLGDDLAKYDVSSLNRITVGGAPARPGLIETLEERFRAPVLNQYGMTEGGATSTGISETRKPGSVGRPFSGCAVRIVDGAGRELPPGERGEVEMRDGGNFTGYVGGPCVAVNADGWRPTGDLGYVDADGDLFLVGRKSDLIIQGGININPGDVEDILRTVPGVADAAAVALPSAYLGEELVACVVTSASATSSNAEIFAACARDLEASRMPVSVHFVDAVPRTELGKIKRRELADSLRVSRQHRRDTSFVRRLRTMSRTARRDAIHQAVQNVVLASMRLVHPATSSVNPDLGLAHQGLTSIDIVRVANELSELVGYPVEPTTFFSHPTVVALSEFLLDRVLSPLPTEIAWASIPKVVGKGARASDEPIAIVGMACRLPGAKSIEAYWRLLCQGIDATSDAPLDRFPLDRRPSADQHEPPTRGGFIDAPFQLDASFFGQSPREAARLRLAQRVLLEVAWEAVEDAAQEPSRLEAATTGVYIGAMGGDALLSGMTSYWLKLRGPSLTIDTACSSSLVAVHLASEALRLGACDVALAGGVHVIDSWRDFAAATSLQLLSPDGRCRTFDAAADGIAMAEGCGIVVLKRLADAVADNDRIVAIIRASVVNHDGRSSSLTAPNGAAQRTLIETAIRRAGVEPAAIGYVEAHGTATKLGDPIEVGALAEAFSSARSRPLLIGSAKTNIGHTQGTAGVAGLIKAALCVERGLVPPTPHFRALNPLLREWSHVVEVSTTLQPWPHPTERRLAGVTSMGLYGTNAHVIVQQAPDRVKEGTSPPPPFLMCMSALDDERRRAHALQVAAFLEHVTADQFIDACYTTASGRRHFPARVVAIADSASEARSLLSQYCATGVARGVIAGEAFSPPRIAFLFTGQGALRPGTGRALWAAEPAFRDGLIECDAILRSLVGFSVAEMLSRDGEATQIGELDDPLVAQPLLFAFEWALSRLWKSWGIQPDAVLGHSLGEYVAACVAGLLSLESALVWVVERARLMRAVSERGAMLSVGASADQVGKWLNEASDAVVIAAVNGPRSTVVSGEAGAVASVAAGLRDAGIVCQPLSVSTAYHSPLMDPILDAFEAVTKRINWTTPQVEFISSCTGRVMQPSEVTNPEYWRRQVREAVQFASATQWAIEHGYRTFLEVGPDSVLTGLGRLIAVDRSDLDWLPSVRGGRDERRQMLESLATLYVRGATPDWQGFYVTASPRRLAMPTYPFRQQSHLWGRMASTRGSSPIPLQSRSAPTAATDSATAASLARQLLNEVLPACGPFSDDQNLLDAGLDSLRLMELLALMKERARVSCTPAEVLARPTLSGLIAMLSTRLPERQTLGSSSAVTNHSYPAALRRGPLANIRTGSGRPLFCMHPLGGEISCYLRLRELAPGQRPIYAIESRGLLVPEREHMSMASMAADYATLMENASPEEPYEICGWSMGACIAHAVASELERRGASIATVTMIDPPAFASAPPDERSEVPLLLAGILASVGRSPGNVIGDGIRIASRCPDTGAAALYEECCNADVIRPEVISLVNFERAWRLRRRHLEVIRSYSPSALDAPVKVWWALEAPARTLDARLSHRPIREAHADGDHFSLMEPRNLRLIFAEAFADR
jgi:acyl transferase domain-containing protein/acyl-CoA synthetase (AMP-forming)/AMP-acid ligase II/pimeloyl-ACP methyl ester carboxylesterase